MTELQILSAIKNNGGSMEYTTLINQNLTDSNRDGLADTARIEQMIKDGLLEGKTEAYCHISITKPGRLYLQDAYKAAEEERKKQAEQKRQQRFDNKISVASLLIPLVTFFLGIIVEFQANIVNWILALFR